MVSPCYQICMVSDQRILFRTAQLKQFGFWYGMYPFCISSTHFSCRMPFGTKWGRKVANNFGLIPTSTLQTAAMYFFPQINNGNFFILDMPTLIWKRARMGMLLMSSMLTGSWSRYTQALAGSIPTFLIQFPQFNETMTVREMRTKLRASGNFCIREVA